MNESYSKVKDGITFIYADERMKILHNEEGFAVIWPNGVGYHYLNDKYLTAKEFIDFQNRKNVDK